jgi:hypothetical protein
LKFKFFLRESPRDSANSAVKRIQRMKQKRLIPDR